MGVATSTPYGRSDLRRLHRVDRSPDDPDADRPRRHRGVRLVGVGLSGFVTHAQGGLFEVEDPGVEPAERPEAYAPSEHAGESTVVGTMLSTRFSPSDERRWRTGMDVEHPEHGTGWVWGAGRRRVTVRFEGPTTEPGPVRTFEADDDLLQVAGPPDWSGAPPQLS